MKLYNVDNILRTEIIYINHALETNIKDGQDKHLTYEPIILTFHINMYN